MNRRDFLQQSGLLCAAGAIGAVPGAVEASEPWTGTAPAGDEMPRFRVRRLTSPANHHFFGYYGMSPWNASGTRMVCLESLFQDRLPTVDEPATVGLVDPASGKFIPISQTYAWNLQQGALLHWNPLHPETEVIFNDRSGRAMKAAIVDVETRSKRYLPRQISGVGATGRHALSLSYGRVGRLRKVVGYAGAEDPNPNDPHPDDDGVFLMELESGETKLVVSIGEVYRRSVEDYPVLAKREMWFNHTVFSRSGERFLFLARSWDDRGRLDSAMFTANLDGSELRRVTRWGSAISHFDWRTDREIVATMRMPGAKETVHVLFTDGGDDHHEVDPRLNYDGHCTFAPGGRWMATDRKDGSTLAQSLWLYNAGTGELMALTMKPMKEKIFISGDTRCDFHPRWKRTGDQICFDAVDPETWTRQVHLVELMF